MISTSHIQAFKQNPRTARTSSTDAVPRKSSLSNTQSASALISPVQNAVETLKRYFRARTEISGFVGFSSTRNFAQNPRMTRIGSMGAVSPEFTFPNIPSASALSAPVQNALERLSADQVTPFDPSGVILHSIGYRGLSSLHNSCAGCWFSSWLGGDRRNRFVSPGGARRRRGLTQGKIHAKSRRN